MTPDPQTGVQLSAECVLGDLVDALADELSLDIANNPHVQRYVRTAVELLGGPYTSYLEGWWLNT